MYDENNDNDNKDFLINGSLTEISSQLVSIPPIRNLQNFELAMIYAEYQKQTNYIVHAYYENNMFVINNKHTINVGPNSGRG